MNNNKTIEDIIAMLDGFSANEGGHMNIVVHNKDIEEKKIENANSKDCSSSSMACQVPTLFEGVDDLKDS